MVSETIADELFFYTSFRMLHRLKIGFFFFYKKPSQNHCYRNQRGNGEQFLMETYCLSGILSKEL